MALVIPDSIPSKASQGEKTLYAILRDCLPDDFLVWYEPYLDGLLPDFVVLGPSFGLLILEVKGWSASQIIQADSNFFKIKQKKDGVERIESCKSPLRQGRDYFSLVMDKFKQYPILTEADGQHQGKLVFPVGVGAVMPNITASQSQKENIYPILPQPQVAYRDELMEWMNFRERELIQRLKEMFTINFPFMALTDDQISTIKGILHPETVIKEEPATSRSVPPEMEIPADASVLVTLDVQQEQLARNLSDGHRVITGVAGSGKTLILLTRAKFFADRNPQQRILVLCFNITLAAYLRSLLKSDTKNLHYANQIDVIHFNDWAKNLLGRLPAPGEKLSGEAYDEYLGEQVLLALSEQSVEQKWNAILIDEAHTFHPNWFRCCVEALKDSENGDLLIVCDRNQKLFKRNDFTWKSVGIKAQGRRTLKLSQNYRNTQEILSAAWSVLELASGEQKQYQEDQTFPIVEPSAALRRGELPILHLTNNKTHAVNAVLRHISNLIKDGYAPEDIAIIYQRNQNYDSLFEKLLDKLDEMEFGGYWITENDNAKRNFGTSTPGVRLVTAKSSLGLEFKVVLIMWLEQFDKCCTSEDLEEATCLCRELYVAMTRAQEILYLVGRSDSQIVNELQKSQYFKIIGTPSVTSSQLDENLDVTKELSLTPPVYKRILPKKKLSQEVDVKFYIFTSDELIAAWTKAYGQPSSLEKSRLRTNALFLAFTDNSVHKAIHIVYQCFKVDSYEEDEDIGDEPECKVQIMQFGVEEVLRAYKQLFYSDPSTKIPYDEQKYIIDNYLDWCIFDNAYKTEFYNEYYSFEQYVAFRLNEDYSDNN